MRCIVSRASRLALASCLVPWLLSIAGSDVAAAQRSSNGTKDSLPDVASLRAPATPAFVLLGVSPTDVARPSAPADVALTLADRSSGFTRLPEDFAMEVSPYWLIGHPRLTWRSDTTRRIDQSIARTFAVSVGTARQDLEDGTPATDIGLGARLMLLSGRLSRATIETLKAVESNAAAQGAIFNRFRRQQMLRLDALHRPRIAVCVADPDPARRRACVEAVNQEFNQLRAEAEEQVRADPAYQEAIAAERAKIDDVTLVREGLFWELAGGAAWRFPSNAWRARDLARTGAWTTISYEGGKLGDGTTWTPVLVGRYLAEDTTGALDAFDVGGRLLMSGPTFALSAEYVRRMWSGDAAPADQYRLSGMLEYKIREDLWVFGAFGRDYDTASEGSVIAQLGLSLAFRRERYGAAGP